MGKTISLFKHKISINLFLFLLLFTTPSIKAESYEHLIMYGQSLSTGHQSWPSLSTENIQGNFMIGSQVWTNFGNTDIQKLYPLVANVAQSVSTLPKTRASSIYAECPLIAATNHIQLKTNGQMKFVASSCGTGGKSIEELSKEYYNNSYIYGMFKNTISYAYNIPTNNFHCPAIFWMQGEFNYAPGGTTTGLTVGSKPTANKQEYKALLIKLKNNMQSEIKSKYTQSDAPLFITYQAGVQYTRGKTLEIGMAQLEASNEYADIVCAGPVYPMTDRGGHLDSNGYRWFGEILGKVYYRTKILGEDFKPLQPMEISRTTNPRILKIKFLVPKLPLVLDESLVNKIVNYGFEVYDNNIKKTINSVSIDNDCVVITLDSDLTGTIEVIYAGTNNSGHGNLRDSDNEPAFYNYINLDKKNTDGTYVYERDNGESTLRPSYEPKDTEGVIYDKPYPLYNFSVGFYYKLQQDSLSYKVPNVNNQPGTNAQDEFTTKDLSGSPLITGTTDLETLGLTVTKSATPPTITVVDGKRQINCLTNQTLMLKATDLTAYPFKPTGDYTLEFRIAVPINNGRGFDLTIKDGKFSYWLMNVSHEKLWGATVTKNFYSLDSKRYHTYRFGIKRNLGEVHVWVDGLYKGIMQTSTSATIDNLLEFGKGSVAPFTNLHIDYVSFDFTGAYKPVSSILEEPTYTKKEMDSAPDLDGTKTPQDAGWSLATSTGMLTVGDGNITIESPINTQYTIQAPSFTITDKFSIEFKAKVESATGRGMDIVIGQELYCLTDTKLYKFSDLFSIAEFSENKFRTFRFAGSKANGYIDVWIDGVYMGTFSSYTDGSRFQIGKNQSGSSTKLLIDYVTLNTDGEYRPFDITGISYKKEDYKRLNVVIVSGGIKVDISESTGVSIFDVTGRNVYSKRLNAGIHFIALNKGLYILDGRKVIVK